LIAAWRSAWCLQQLKKAHAQKSKYEQPSEHFREHIKELSSTEDSGRDKTWET